MTRPAGEPASRRDLVGQVVGDKYRLRSIIGEGGMGAVFEAEHLQIGRLVAVKVLHPKEAEKAEAVSRLEHEARIAGRIGHPNICEVYDIGRLPDDSPYLVMERLQGETLAQRIQRAGPVPPYEAVDIMLQVLSALVAAHERDVVHRDLKPENIFLSQRAGMLPVAKILDFGISKVVGVEDTSMDLTQPGMVMGTPYYMAPEQARGDRQIDHRVDLWAAGVILYESLTGQRPFVARNYNALLVQILTVWHRPVTELAPGVSTRLSKIVDRALAKPREERFQSATEFLDQLRRFKRRLSSQVSAQKQPPSRPEPQKIRVHEIHDEGTEDGTIVFARVQDSREIVVAPVDASGRPIAPQAAPPVAPVAPPPAAPVAPPVAPPAPRHAAVPPPYQAPPGRAAPAPAPAPPAPAAPRPPAPRAAASPPNALAPGVPRPAPPRPAAGSPPSAPRPGVPPPSTRAVGGPPPSTRAVGGPPPSTRAGAPPQGYGYVEDPTTIPTDGSPPEDVDPDEVTMVDPPSFNEDSVTTVRRDPRSRRDRG